MDAAARAKERDEKVNKELLQGLQSEAIQKES